MNFDEEQIPRACVCTRDEKMSDALVKREVQK